MTEDGTLTQEQRLRMDSLLDDRNCQIYAVMKPVRTDVVDQGDLDARRAACERELALNARLAQAEIMCGQRGERLPG